ncbi:hypothetical protein LTR37_000590 [Vermiconidia calcicola]|uniref:Uncharacterized protein n=1 Tax=Vermiconidia calcicola TaxID=1690605 RepID=A0ACC3NZI1_9PEZI|nr:hypothetical protein LTR37_000590 [Vermiconidia calcicola]
MVTTRRQTGAAEAMDDNIDVFNGRPPRTAVSTKEVLPKSVTNQPSRKTRKVRLTAQAKPAHSTKRAATARTTPPTKRTGRATPVYETDAANHTRPLKISLPPKAALPAKTIVQSRRKQLSRAPKLGNHVLFLFIGPQRELVTLHTEIIPTAVQEHINERSAGLQLYELAEQDPDIFRIYPSAQQTATVQTAMTWKRYSDAEWTRLAHLYLLGVTLKDEKFANTVITCIIEKMGEADRYPTGIASEVYACTPAGDGLRELIVDVHVWKGHGTWISAPHDDADAPKELFTDVIAALAKVGGEIHEEGALMPWEGRGKECMRYHAHEGTARCKD